MSVSVRAGWWCPKCLRDGRISTAPVGVSQPACPHCGSEMKRYRAEAPT